ncbi:MAG: LysE family translocator [Pseudohongiellaceae bacterium]
MENPLLYLMAALLASFLGTVPVGPINLAVVKTTVDFNPHSGLKFALGASVVEIFHALIAIFFGMFISDFLETSIFIKLFIATAFIVLAVVMFLRKTTPKFSEDNATDTSFFRRGLLIAALNPQAVPFWMFALATISQYANFSYAGYYLAFFMAGVLVGKLSALYGFVRASDYIRDHLVNSCRSINKMLAVVLFLIGLSQVWNVVASTVMVG